MKKDGKGKWYPAVYGVLNCLNFQRVCAVLFKVFLKIQKGLLPSGSLPQWKMIEHLHTVSLPAWSKRPPLVCRTHCKVKWFTSVGSVSPSDWKFHWVWGWGLFPIMSFQSCSSILFYPALYWLPEKSKAMGVLIILFVYCPLMCYCAIFLSVHTRNDSEYLAEPKL